MNDSREIILAKREGFDQAIELLRFNGWRATINHAQQRRDELYPLPTVSVPRILVDEWGTAWKFDDGDFWYSLSGRDLKWIRVNRRDCEHELTAFRVRIWFHLLEHPTAEKEVPDYNNRRAYVLDRIGERFPDAVQGVCNQPCPRDRDGKTLCIDNGCFFARRENSGAGEAGGLLSVPANTESSPTPLAKTREVL